MPKKNKQLEQQIEAFAGSTAGSVVIAVGIGVVAFPYAVEYIVKKTTEKGGAALVYAVGIMVQGMKGEAGKVKDLLDAKAEWLAKERKKVESETWHEANPDVTQADIDIPEGVQAYFAKVGLPASSMVVAYGDKEALSVYQHSGEWSLYGTRRINGQQYWLVVPKGIRVYVKFEKKVYDPDTYPERCQPQVAAWDKDPDCYNIIKEQFLLTPSVWP